jgi:hypothetical protein
LAEKESYKGLSLCVWLFIGVTQNLWCVLNVFWGSPILTLCDYFLFNLGITALIQVQTHFNSF